MKKMEYKGIDITYYRETLENGLEVVLIPMADKKNYFITYATRFGSEITQFAPKDTKQEVKVPDGIAHFLEHKMFEQEDGVDPFTFYSKSGTGSNASTSFDFTQYICYGTKKFDENLRYLIRFVNEPYYTDENVEKEKGIIAQELNMYNDMPDFQLEMRLRKNIYHKLPRRIDIGGSVKEINKITKEDLYLCYNNFYSPNNMFIVIVGNFNHKEASKIIYEELELKENKDYPKVKHIDEPKEVRLKTDSFKSTVEVPKVAVGLKVHKKDIGINDELQAMLYLRMITRMLFGDESSFKEKVMENKLTTGMYTEWELAGDFRTYYLMAESNEPNKLIKEIKEAFETAQDRIDEETFERIIKVWIANYVRGSDIVDNMVDSAFEDMLYNKEIIGDKIDIFKGMTFKKLKEVIKKIDFDNISICTMHPNK